MELTDTHCHLQFEKLRDRRNEVLADAAKNGVKRMICVGTSLADSQTAAQLAKGNDGIWAAAGTHPHDAGSFLADKNAPERLRKIAAVSKVVAIGETGLDYYRQLSSKTDQQAALRVHIEAGLELDRPFIFHVRDAWDDFWQILDTYKGLRGVVHSFSSHGGHLDEVLSRGLYVGLNGIMTFTKDNGQLAAAKAVPSERLLLETDAPFLTPAPFRGELCEPKHVLPIAQFLAELRNEKLEDLAQITTANAEKLFGIEDR